MVICSVVQHKAAFPFIDFKYFFFPSLLPLKTALKGGEIMKCFGAATLVICFQERLLYLPPECDKCQSVFQTF